MNKIISGCTVVTLLLVAGCGPTQIPELTIKAEYRPTMNVKGASPNSVASLQYVAFKEQGDSEKIDVMYSFGGNLFLGQEKVMPANLKKSGATPLPLPGQAASKKAKQIEVESDSDGLDIHATFPGEFEKYAQGGFIGWKITPIPPMDFRYQYSEELHKFIIDAPKYYPYAPIYQYSKEELESIAKEYKPIILGKQSSIRLVPKQQKLWFGGSATVKVPEIVKGAPVELAMKNYTIPPAYFKIEAFSELRNIPGEYDKVRSGYGLVKFLYPWRVQCKFSKDPWVGRWLDAAKMDDDGNFMINIALPLRPDNKGIDLQLRVVFNTDYPEDVIAYPTEMQKHLNQKITWTGAEKMKMSGQEVSYNWNCAEVKNVSGNHCRNVTFKLEGIEKQFNIAIVVSDANSEEIK